MFRAQEMTLAAALRDLGDPSWEARARAAWALGTSDEADREQAAAALRRALVDCRGEVRYAAARSLGELRDRDAVALLLARLGDDDVQVQAAAALALGLIGDKVAFMPLVDALHEGPPEVRFQAAAALAVLDLPRAAPYLRAALDDPDPEVRGNAAAALGEGPPDEETLGALGRLLGDEHLAVRAEAAFTLGRLGDRRAVPTLCTLLDDPQRGLEAATLLGELPDERSVPVLRAVLRRFGASALLKVRCAFALARLHPDEGRGPLQRATRSLRLDVRGLAAELLARLDGVASAD